MKKVLLVLFILVDLAIMAAAAFFLYTHLRKTPSGRSASVAPVRVAPPAPAPSTMVATSTAPTALSRANAPAPATPAEEGPQRKILFTYANSKARQVSIRADFTGWKAEPMKRDEKGVWTYQAALEAGEYGYAYSIVDDAGNSRTIRDMANPKTKKIGTQFVSSIVVDAAPKR